MADVVTPSPRGATHHIFHHGVWCAAGAPWCMVRCWCTMVYGPTCSTKVHRSTMHHGAPHDRDGELWYRGIILFTARVTLGKTNLEIRLEIQLEIYLQIQWLISIILATTIHKCRKFTSWSSAVLWSTVEQVLQCIWVLQCIEVLQCIAAQWGTTVYFVWAQFSKSKCSSFHPEAAGGEAQCTHSDLYTRGHNYWRLVPCLSSLFIFEII